MYLRSSFIPFVVLTMSLKSPAWRASFLFMSFLSVAYAVLTTVEEEMGDFFLCQCYPMYVSISDFPIHFKCALQSGMWTDCIWTNRLPCVLGSSRAHWKGTQRRFSPSWWSFPNLRTTSPLVQPCMLAFCCCSSWKWGPQIWWKRIIWAGVSICSFLRLSVNFFATWCLWVCWSYPVKYA